MAQVINTNVASLNAQRNLNTSQGNLQTSLQRLSSGLRINSAKDDAAGLAISERFTTQIRGLSQAARNASDGISLAQTGEGDLAQVTNNLQRIRELAVQSANATNSSSDRAALQLETAELIAEIERVSSTSAFNGVKLLDGSFSSQLFQVGANAGETVSIANISSARTSDIGQVLTASQQGTAVTGALTAGDLLINGNDVGAVEQDALAIANAITATDSNVSATATNEQTGITFADVVGTAAAPASPTENTVTAVAGTAGGAENFILTIDGTEAVNITMASAEEVIADHAAELDSDFAAFIAASDGAYSIVSGSLSGEDLVLSKADGTAITFDTSTSTLTSVAASVTESETTGGTPAVAGVAPAYTLSIDGTTLDFSVAGADGTIDAAEVADLINDLAGYTATAGTGTLDITKEDGSNLVLVESGADSGASEGLDTDGTGGAATTTLYGSVEVTGVNEDELVIAGANPGAAGLTVASITATLQGETIANTDISTVAGANAAIASVDSALTSINTSRASLGAIQNRFESIVASIETSVENLSSARSRIRDADFASETATLTRNQILQQAGVSILSQANSLPQLALSLLQ
ncbi:MAG TPA: flagellin [Gammaproteobacteria bacterium]